MSTAAIKQVVSAYKKIDKITMEYSRMFSTSWGLYSEFRTPKKLRLNKSRQEKEAFGLHFDKLLNSNPAIELGDKKYGVMSASSGSCREYFQDSIWNLLKATGSEVDIEAIKKEPRTNIFWETSAYTKKKYKSRRTWDVLNGGIWCDLIQKYYSRCSSDQMHNQVKILDLFFGVPFALLDQYPDTLKKRKETKKGVAGRYVLSDVGESKRFLYLLPGNIMIRAPWVSSFSIGLLRTSIRAAVTENEGVLKALERLVSFRDMRNAMNNSNYKVLKKVYEKIKPLFNSYPLEGFGPGIMSDQSRTGVGNCPHKNGGAPKSAVTYMVDTRIYVPIVAYEFIVSKGGFPAMDNGIKENWKLKLNACGTHGRTAVGWGIASWAFCANNLDEYEAFYKNYKKTKANF